MFEKIRLERRSRGLIARLDKLYELTVPMAREAGFGGDGYTDFTNGAFFYELVSEYYTIFVRQKLHAFRNPGSHELDLLSLANGLNTAVMGIKGQSYKGPFMMGVMTWQMIWEKNFKNHRLDDVLMQVSKAAPLGKIVREYPQFGLDAGKCLEKSVYAFSVHSSMARNVIRFSDVLKSVLDVASSQEEQSALWELLRSRDQG